MATKLGRIISYDDGNLRMMSHDSMTTWSHGFILPCTMPATTKRGRMVTYYEETSPIITD